MSLAKPFKITFATLPLLFFVACPGGSSSGNDGNNSAASAELPAFPAVRQDIMYTYTPAATLSGYTYSATNLPAWATIDPTTGVVSGCPTDPGTLPAIVVTATKGRDVQTVTTLNLDVAGDPLVRLSWNMENLGQTSYAGDAGVSGQDMLVRQAMCAGATGMGVRIAVSDTGVEINHEDLAGNIIPGASKDYSGTAPYFGNPVALASAGEPAHGTAVSGIAAAVGWNGVGMRGIAPEAGLAGFNYLSYQTTPGADIDQLGGDYDIFNQSWGPGFSNPAEVSYAQFDDVNYLPALAAGVANGRGGNGSIYVRAGGNDYYFSDMNSQAPYTWRSRNACMEADNSNPYVIVIGATNANGVKSSYSSTGACLWISGLGGEFGYNHAEPTAFPLYGVENPAIIATNLMGCTAGGFAESDLTDPPNPFETGSLPINSNCNYTSVMNGTSAATPSIGGIVALMLSANPNLGWRDVKDILAKTATKIDPNNAPLHNALDPANYYPDAGWITNAAGFNFNNWYGFGRGNAQAAVAMAQTYVSSMGTQEQLVSSTGTWLYSQNVNLKITADNVTTPTSVSTIAVTQNYTIEEVQIQISVTYPFIGDLGVELISPSGTMSTMLNTNSADTEANLAGITLLSNAFYGESSAGTWTIKIIDGATGNTGTFTNWKINVIGH